MELDQQYLSVILEIHTQQFPRTNNNKAYHNIL